ncbi:hypothetical protein [Paenibacillus sp. OSY-SE]|uniref:hypothetical protein n=1 Tax=Paenibacillus sp. OSY-SE TaxID=1196323 RepID=UPI0002E43887|nr:hypothetical protein [Paenibacillus sp. OSY-SE]
MLAESIIRIGRPIVQSDLPNQQRIRWLTDVDSENCKNFFQHVFLIELDGDNTAFHFIQIGDIEDKSFVPNKINNIAFPILYPNGGNPLHAQGIYPVPCYLMYEAHIHAMEHPESFAVDVIFPRLKNTVSFRQRSEEQLLDVARRSAASIAPHFEQFIKQEKQLGILYIYDHSLSVYRSLDKRSEDDRYLWIAESRLSLGKQLHIDGDQALAGIIEAKFTEAKSLGSANNAISTFTNQEEEEVASIYNKFWLWMSPTWEMPRSIYWGKDEWIRGIKVDRVSYEAFLYGTQFLKQITVPVTSAILKEMFAPVTSMEAKRHMKHSSFEPIFGVPFVLPLLEGDVEQLYYKYKRILNQSDKSDDDIHLELLAGIHKFIPQMSDEHRLMIVYYSGDLSRGNMHIRKVIEDVVPSVAALLQKIIKDLNRQELLPIVKALRCNTDKEYHRLRSLPSLLANAYGPGYVWSSLQTVLHREPITVHRLYKNTCIKLLELALKEDEWGMREELVFHHGFLAFYARYQEEVLQSNERVNTLADWERFIDHYHAGEISLSQLQLAEELGFVTGLLLKQFSHSYHRKTGKDFVKQRVMKFGSKLTPDMIWKYGVLRCEELAEQRDMGLGKNFRPVLAQVLLGFLEAEQTHTLHSDKDKFMTAFWSGYLMYKKEEE